MGCSRYPGNGGAVGAWHLSQKLSLGQLEAFKLLQACDRNDFNVWLPRGSRIPQVCGFRWVSRLVKAVDFCDLGPSG